MSDDLAGTFDISLDSADGTCSLYARIEVASGLDFLVAKVSSVTLALSGLAAILHFGLTVNSGSIWEMHLELDAEPQQDKQGRWRVTLRTAFLIAALLAAPALVIMLQQMTVWASTVEVALGVTLPLTFVTAVLPAILRRLRAVV